MRLDTSTRGLIRSPADQQVGSAGNDLIMRVGATDPNSVIARLKPGDDSIVAST
jgi:hypothetical protein